MKMHLTNCLTVMLMAFVLIGCESTSNPVSDPLSSVDLSFADKIYFKDIETQIGEIDEKELEELINQGIEEGWDGMAIIQGEDGSTEIIYFKDQGEGEWVEETPSGIIVTTRVVESPEGTERTIEDLKKRMYDELMTGEAVSDSVN